MSAATCVILVYLHRTDLRSIWTISESHMTNKQIRPLCDTEADCFFVINPCVYAVKCRIFNVFLSVAHTSVSRFRNQSKPPAKPEV